MNRFRTKKKGKETSEGVGRPSNDSDAPAMPAVKPSKTFRLGKKQQEPEPKPELDLSTALPSSDDFRTSLLMSGLSARFSMLREQDDPTSKIGKASDDSVLFPTKRQSRMNDFGYQSHGLSDIAEVSSINGSIRPPFAASRTDSFGTGGYGTDDDSIHSGSIMNRPKPGEGNNLFGGRQKIYKIPAGAKEGSSSGGMGGRALYENDVSQSAFQKLREREKEQQREEIEEAEQDTPYTRSTSPPPSGYNRNRETSSTTSSAGPSITRSSTAATSFTSQRTPSLNGSHTPITPATTSTGSSGIERTGTKTRRLYETGLDQHLNEQQSSAMNRIDTLTRQRTFGAQTPPLGIGSPTGLIHPAERWDRHQVAGKASMPNMRTTSPSPTTGGRGNFDFGVRPNLVTERLQAFGGSAPLSPPISGDDDTTVLTVQPNDRGKATALGAFTKPMQPYDENKYTQRQLQMQQGREGRDSPSLRKNSPPRPFIPRQQPAGRPRGDSSATFASASARSRSNSSVQRKFMPQERIQDAPTPQIIEREETLNLGTFLASPNSSSLGSPDDPEPQNRRPVKPSELYNKYRQEQLPTIERPPESEHPANRQHPFEPLSSSDENGSPMLPSSKPRLRIEESPTPEVRVPGPSDSPTLGPTTGLSSMVRQHMRIDSNASSMYGGSTYGGLPSSGFASRFPDEPTEPLPQNQYLNGSNPWDNDDWDRQKDSLGAKKDGSIAPQPLALRSPNAEASQEERKADWEKELEAHHKRNGSSETQKEQQDFKMDLAARRRRVQENLKSFVETESRSASPAPGGSDWQKEGQSRNNPLGLLKNKTSRGSLINRSDKPGQSKAMKMLGLGQATISSSPSPGRSSFDEDPWKNEEEEMLRSTKNHVLPPLHPAGPIIPPQTKAFRQARRDAQRDRERQVALRHQQKQVQEGVGNGHQSETQPQPRDRAPPNIRVGQRSPSRDRHPPPVSIRPSLRTGTSQEGQASQRTTRSGSQPGIRPTRDRSSSSASERSKSRNGRHRDDMTDASLNNRVPQGLNPPLAQYLPRSPGASPGLPHSPSPMHSPNPASRNRSNSKSGYFDGHKLQPLQTGDGIDISLSPRPSPITAYSANTTPSLKYPSPATSRVNTPTAPGFQDQSRVPGARKRSVNKSDISEPKFVSSTFKAETVDLAPGVSLMNGSDPAPPIPAVNPRRKTRAIFGFGKKEEFDDYFIPAATQSTEEMSTFSADENDRPKGGRKLRKISSEGGNMNLRARQAAIAAPSPAVPAFPPSAGNPPQGFPGGMF
ncbi:hypothetical protein B0O99DRAFT_505369 [Bisporella sp. PMI_857]|nr:hypothetical protein B0O99DRAFT_505369 [Bisporella sp. PMI_857]